MRSEQNCGGSALIGRMSSVTAALLLAAAVARAADGVRVMAVGAPDVAAKQWTMPQPVTGVQYPPGYGPVQVAAVTGAGQATEGSGPATTPTQTVATQGATAPAVEGPVVLAKKYTIQFDGADPKAVAGLRPELTLEKLYHIPLTLTLSNGILGPKPTADSATNPAAPQVITTTVAQLGGQKARPEAIASVGVQIVAFLHEQGLYGVWVGPDDKAQTASLTPEGAAEFPLIIHVVKVTSVSGGEAATRSPIKPAGKSPAAGILMKDDLDDYLLRLNRYPSRRVDAAVAANIPEGQSKGIDGLALSYLTTTQKPWILFAQVSNTGTSQTNVWRERFGFVDNELTGNDDNLTVDFTTAGFDDTSNNLSLSYELPLFKGSNPTRFRAYASYGNFVASDVGLANLQFLGDTTAAGGEFIQPLLQIHEFFLDGVAGFRYEHERVDNQGIDKGTGDFSQPYVGLRVERTTPESSLVGGMTLTGTYISASQQSIDNLGRIGADQTTVVLTGNLSYAFYLEPLLDRANYEAQKSTLAHEIYLGARAQEAFDYRLVPSSQDVIGGLYSVRGYPESIAAGDSIVIATAEYRMHIPRMLGVAAPGKDFLGKPFRYAPQSVYGRPDWDLVAKAFVDVGQTYLNNKIAGETNTSLLGTGVGLEMLIRQNISIRADWGVALQEVNDPTSNANVSAGSNRFHLVFTLSY